MKCKPYLKYKDSGVESLGQVPDGWGVTRIKHLGGGDGASIQMGPFGSMLTTLTAEPTGYRLFGQENTISGDFLIGERWLTEEQYRSLEKYALRPGDIVLTRKGSLGKARLVPSDIQRGIADSDTIRVRMNGGRPTRELMVRLLHEANYLRVQIEINTRGAILGGLNTSTIGNLWIAVPGLDEEARIIQFLELETWKIDTLIAKQERLIELLQEKRRALISHAVTKGLHPDAPMKPSGVEWLGDVPTRWDIRPVKLIARIGNGSTPSRDNPGYWEGGNYPWLNSSVVNQEAVTEAQEFVTLLALRECHLPKIVPPAVLIGITGQGRTRGMASTLLFESTINQHVAYLKPYPRHADVGFLRRVFDMAYPFLRSESDAGGSTKGAITCEQIAHLKIPIPPLSEQIAIATYLDSETAKIDTLAAKVESAIAHMREHRTTLISAAVTGKIDVREPSHA